MPIGPNELDLSIRDAVSAPLSAYVGSFELDFAWSDAASMWFTEVRPAREGCADISVGHDGRGDLYVTIANAHFELWDVTDVSGLAHLSDIIGSVAAGRVQVFGSEKDPTIRIELAGGDIFRAGPVRIPRPSASRRVHTFLSYA